MDILGGRGHSPRRMQAEAPNWAYFRAVAGRWGGPLDFAITDWRAFRAARMPLGDRLSLLAMASLTRVVGAFQLETGVDVASGASRDEVVHTTRVSKWGVTLLRSVDTLRLDRNGRDMTMRIELGLWPALRRVRVAADPSPRQLCVRQGWIPPGGAAVCLPNRVSVENAAAGYDTLNY